VVVVEKKSRRRGPGKKMILSLRFSRIVKSAPDTSKLKVLSQSFNPISG
jgi:hypothetical protein